MKIALILFYTMINLFSSTAVSGINTRTFGLHVINTETTHVRMKPTFSGRRQIQVNCSNPNINQYTTATTALVTTQQADKLVTKQTSKLTATVSATTALKPTQQMTTLQPVRQTTGSSKDFLYLNNTCSVPFNDLPGWTVIQRRCNGVVDFNRTYADYENGFGDKNGEMWIGNKWLYNNTANSPLILRFDIQAPDGTHFYVEYNSFQVGSPNTYYTLNISGFSGNVQSDQLANHNGRAFTTFDADHDLYSTGNCADWSMGSGGFWYYSCYSINPNGNYYPISSQDPGIYWPGFSRISFFQMSVHII